MREKNVSTRKNMLTQLDHSREPKPVKKPTKFLTSSSRIAQRLSKRCPGDHEHCLLKGGNRCSRAQVYPDGLCQEMVLGYKEQMADELGSHANYLDNDDDGELHFNETPCSALGREWGLNNLEMWWDDPEDNLDWKSVPNPLGIDVLQVEDRKNLKTLGFKDKSVKCNVYQV